MKSFSCTLLALAAGMAIAGQLASAHRIEVERLGDHATHSTGYSFEADFGGSVGSLKERIALVYQLPLEKLHIFWMGNSQPDSFSLARFANSTVNGRQPSLVIDGDLIKVVKPDGRERYFVVGDSDTIADLKKAIEKREDIPTKAQHLMRDGQELQDSVRVASLLSADGIALNLVLTTGQRIEVERLGDHATIPTGYYFDETLKGTVGELKQRAAAAYQVPIEKVHVFWMGNSQPDSFNLDRFTSSTSFDRQPSLVLDANLIKIIKPDGSSRVVGAEATDTIADLKKKIDRLEDIPAIVQRLMRGDQELQDGEQVASLLSEGNQQTVFRLVVAAKQD